LLADALDRLVHIRPCLLSQDLTEEVSENADVHSERLIELSGRIGRDGAGHGGFIALSQLRCP
jgi:hypothetical protein